MFTGIVRERGRVESFDERRLVVQAPETAGTTGIGDSVAIDGVCLTAVQVENGTIGFDVAVETVRRAKPFGAVVNVELPVRAGEPLGGHYVQGHVDGIGRVGAVAREGDGRRVRIEAPAELRRYLVEKGSVAVDGVSLTVAELDETSFAAALVPHTLEVTTLGTLEPGDEVNIEVDILAKYVEQLTLAAGVRSAR